MYKKLCIDCGLKEYQELHDNHKYFPEQARVYMEKCDRCGNERWIFTEDIWQYALNKARKEI